MCRWKTLGLALLALCLVAGPVSAQKVLCDQSSAIGFNIYAHNWHSTMNNLGGGYVFFFTNAGLFGGPPIFLDNVRNCWIHEGTRGGGPLPLARSGGDGLAVTEFSIVICNIANGGLAAGPIAGTSTIAGWAETVANSDLCLAPFNANPVFLTGGFFVPTTFFGFGPGCWIVARIFGSPVVVATSVTNNGNVWFGGTVVYEIQHGYNGTPTNQMYLALVSIDEVTYPYAGGIAAGDANYGTADGWGPGQIASSTRIVSLGTGYAFTLPGQSAEGNCDGLDLDNAVAMENGVSIPGKKNASCVDFNGAPYYDYGDGGGDWTSGNCDLFNIKVQDYWYGQLNGQGISNCPDPNGNLYKVLVLWSRTWNDCLNPFDPVTGQFFSVVPDGKTTQMLTNPKAVANINFTKNFVGCGLVGDLGNFLLFDCAWPAFSDGVNTLKLGTASFPRGDNPGSPNGDKLDLCNPKAGPAGLKKGRAWVVGYLVICRTPAGVENFVDSGHLGTISIN